VSRRYRIIVAIILAVSISNVAIAGEISYGVKTGLIMSNLTQTPKEWNEAKSYKAGFTGGVFLNYAFNESFSLQPELLYTMKGVRSNLYDGLVSVDMTASFDYIELPVLAMYTFSSSRNFKPRIFAGPSFAYTVSSEIGVSAWIFSTSVDFSSLTHVTDFGLVAGAGFGYDLGKGTITFDARYELGFTNVIMSGDFEINGSTQTISEDDFKNCGFAFLVGYGF
jgi:outer membrane protein W